MRYPTRYRGQKCWVNLVFVLLEAITFHCRPRANAIWRILDWHCTLILHSGKPFGFPVFPTWDTQCQWPQMVVCHSNSCSVINNWPFECPTCTDYWHIVWVVSTPCIISSLFTYCSRVFHNIQPGQVFAQHVHGQNLWSHFLQGFFYWKYSIIKE